VTWAATPYFELILESLDHIEMYRPATKAEFLGSAMAQDAIILRLQVIGENLRQLQNTDEERFARSADRSWFQVIGLRHRISHGYQTVDREAIWQIIAEELIAFRASIEAAIDRY
jgi:uncharacterized protein with HEPN domain